jgi:hypothetical protein
MEDLLAVCARSPQNGIPVVCLDEFAKKFLSETRQPVAAIPGHLARAGYEYVRDGSMSGFMIAMPHPGKRALFVGSGGQRNSKDFAGCLDFLAIHQRKREDQTQVSLSVNLRFTHHQVGTHFRVSFMTIWP